MTVRSELRRLSDQIAAMQGGTAPAVPVKRETAAADAARKDHPTFIERPPGSLSPLSLGEPMAGTLQTHQPVTLADAVALKQPEPPKLETNPPGNPPALLGPDSLTRAPGGPPPTPPGATPYAGPDRPATYLPVSGDGPEPRFAPVAQGPMDLGRPAIPADAPQPDPPMPEGAPIGEPDSELGRPPIPADAPQPDPPQPEGAAIGEPETEPATPPIPPEPPETGQKPEPEPEPKPTPLPEPQRQQPQPRQAMQPQQPRQPQ